MTGTGGRDLARLPQAHLHLTGGMRLATPLELAAEQGTRPRPELAGPVSAGLDVTTRRGWSRLQRLTTRRGR